MSGSMSSGLFAQPFASNPRYTQQSGSNYYTGSSTKQTNHNPFRGSPAWNQQRKNHRIVKQVMRVVLLSPLVVLALWSVLVTSRSVTNSPAESLARTSQLHNSQLHNSRHFRHHPGSSGRTTNNQRFERAKEHLLEVVEVMGEALGEEEPVLVAANVVTATNTNNLSSEAQPVVAVTQAQPRGAAAGMIVQPDYSDRVAEQAQQQYTLQQDQTTVSETAPLQQGQGQISLMQAAAQPSLSLPVAEGNFPVTQQAAMVTASHPNVVAPIQAAVEAPPVTAKAQPENIVYLYYDPRQLQTNAQGQVVLPDQLYDAQGRVFSTVQLVQQQQQRGARRKVYLEPPQRRQRNQVAASSRKMEAPLQLMATDVTSQMLAQEEPVATASAAQQTSSSVKAAQASFNQNSESIYDQSILISTVGIMALLVGAISARRMRSRSNWLQVCIENESLEDEAAFDDAHTVVGDASDYGTYNTFGWKGDLEKFDV